MYQLVVEFDKFLVALDGSSGDVAKRVEAVRREFPDKPFRFVLASHHHNDHLHGLDDFVQLGASVLASPDHASAIRGYLEAQGADQSSIVEVADSLTIQAAGRDLHIIDIGPVPHSERMLVAYLPKEKILFAADLFVLGGRREPPRPRTANASALLNAIDTRQLNVERIVDPHSPLIATIDDLRRSVARESQAVAGDLQHWQTAAAAFDLN